MDAFEHSIDGHAQGFSPRNARVLFDAAVLAYDKLTFRDSFSGGGYLIIKTTTEIIVAFPGTNEIKDWIVDADFAFSECPWGKVHAGFWFAFDRLKERLVQELDGEILPIYFTGHSLGGALALIAARYFVDFMMIGGVYTFGAPRVWNPQAADNYNHHLKPATYNLVNACDPVPLLPPLSLDYRDGGTEIFMPVEGGYQTDPFIGWELFDDLIGAFRSWRKHKLAFIPNHFTDHYRPKLAALN